MSWQSRFLSVCPAIIFTATCSICNEILRHGFDNLNLSSMVHTSTLNMFIQGLLALAEVELCTIISTTDKIQSQREIIVRVEGRQVSEPRLCLLPVIQGVDL